MYYDELINTIDNHASVFTILIFVPLKATVVFLVKKLRFVLFVTIIPLLFEFSISVVIIEDYCCAAISS